MTPYNDVEPIFNGVCYDYTIKQGIAGRLSFKHYSKSMDTKLKQMSRKRRRFIEGQLQRAINNQRDYYRRT